MSNGVYGNFKTGTTADLCGRRVLNMSGSLANYINTGNAGDSCEFSNKNTNANVPENKKGAIFKFVAGAMALAAAAIGVVAFVKKDGLTKAKKFISNLNIENPFKVLKKQSQNATKKVQKSCGVSSNKNTNSSFEKAKSWFKPKQVTEAPSTDDVAKTSADIRVQRYEKATLRKTKAKDRRAQRKVDNAKIRAKKAEIDGESAVSDIKRKAETLKAVKQAKNAEKEAKNAVKTAQKEAKKVAKDAKKAAKAAAKEAKNSQTSMRTDSCSIDTPAQDNIEKVVEGLTQETPQVTAQAFIEDGVDNSAQNLVQANSAVLQILEEAVDDVSQDI